MKWNFGDGYLRAVNTYVYLQNMQKSLNDEAKKKIKQTTQLSVLSVNETSNWLKLLAGWLH